MSNPEISQAPVPLDMGQFDTITNGKSTHKDELLKIFFLNSADCIAVMEKNCANDILVDKWLDALAELREISNSIGALEIATACAVAEKTGDLTAEDRKKMLLNVKALVKRLQAFVKKD